MISPTSKKAKRALRKFMSTQGYLCSPQFFYCANGCPRWVKPVEKISDTTTSHLKFTCQKCLLEWFVCQRCNNQQSVLTTEKKLRRHWRDNCVSTTAVDENQSLKRQASDEFMTCPEPASKKRKTAIRSHPIQNLTSGIIDSIEHKKPSENHDVLSINVSSFHGVQHTIKVLSRNPKDNYPFLSNKEFLDLKKTIWVQQI